VPEPPLKFEQFTSSLADGTPVLVRPIRPEDKALLAAGFDRLSDESRYRRFMAPVTELSEEQLTKLTEIDYVNHFAWIALRADRPEEGMGVARYVRVEEEPTVAEAAVTVLDDYQGRGLGTLLLALLAVAARAAGIERFRAYVLEENAPMIAMLEGMGATIEFDSPGVMRADMPLELGAVPDSPAGRVLKAVAQEALRLERRPTEPSGSDTPM
jgi:RimJ/RimL family protein N-acetyltransferase